MSTVTENRMSEENYKRLLTLAKQKYEERVRELNITEAEEELYSFKGYRFLDLRGKQKVIARKIMRPAVRQYTQAPMKWNRYLTGVCHLEKEIQIEINPEEKKITDQFAGKKIATGDLLKVTLYPTPAEEVVVYGYTMSGETCTETAVPNHRDIIVADLPYFFAGIYLYRRLAEEIKRMQEMTAEERKLDYNYQIIMRLFADTYKRYPDLFQMKGKEVAAYCKDYLATADSVLSSSKAYYNPYKISYITAKDIFVNEAFQYFMFKRMIFGRIPFHGYFDFVNYSPKKKRGQIVLTEGFEPFSHYEFLVNSLEETRISVVRNYKKYKASETEYAKSYMTKKNQSVKLKNKIAGSLFWDYFGYVEYDEDIDYDAIEQYEKEFEIFYHKYFKGLDLSENTIRFRKLGQHHAAGLYYPHAKCLCVDISYPGSFIHELGHLIDHEYGDLSQRDDFAKVRIASCDYYEKRKEEDDAFAKKLGGNTKYNIDYYTEPTEIFARSFELYVYYIWHENSSLLESNYNDPQYECTKENLERIKEYFDKILK